ncbi:MAG: hypothetical protein GJV46_13435 [Geobacter sp.]|nr:hypothetical protein [Geobacter sp.]
MSEATYSLTKHSASSLAAHIMPGTSLYSSILGLSSQWHITDAALDSKARCLRLQITTRGGADFCCPVCGGAAKRVGSDKRRWQHDDLLSLCFMISAVIPVASCENCGTNRITAPWERSGSSFRSVE